MKTIVVFAVLLAAMMMFVDVSAKSHHHHRHQGSHHVAHRIHAAAKHIQHANKKVKLHSIDKRIHKLMHQIQHLQSKSKHNHMKHRFSSVPPPAAQIQAPTQPVRPAPQQQTPPAKTTPTTPQTTAAPQKPANTTLVVTPQPIVNPVIVNNADPWGVNPKKLFPGQDVLQGRIVDPKPLESPMVIPKLSMAGPGLLNDLDYKIPGVPQPPKANDAHHVWPIYTNNKGKVNI